MSYGGLFILKYNKADNHPVKNIMKYIYFALIIICLAISACVNNKSEKTNISLNLLKTPVDGGLKSASDSFWGGSVIKSDDGIYHMFASTFANNCGLGTWKFNSKIVHATSTHPLGPFLVKETVIPAMAHNPSIRKTPDNKFVLFFTGEQLADEELVSWCENGITYDTAYVNQHTRSCIINYIEAESLDGPWSEPQTILDLSIIPNCSTNPSPLIMPKGEVMMYYRAYDPNETVKMRHLYVTKAQSYKGPYNDQSIQIMEQLAEDPFVWYMNKKFHVLFNNKFYDPLNTGGYATSTTGDKFEVQKPLYSRIVNFDDGSSKEFLRRERPHFLPIDNTRAVLYSGVKDNDSTDYTYIIATPVGNWTAKQLARTN